ncbi:MAG: Tetrathionate reductase two-component response regulator [Candidatus Ruthia sp. Asou_11_S2]|nr:Tetrathionate reductase two-component response regulator [Candidatus Ruthia sp. Asou_11_S2]
MELTSSVICKTIFVVVEDKQDQEFISSFFTSKKFSVKFFSSCEVYISQVDDTQGCLIVDISMPDMDGPTILNRLNKIEHLSPVVFIANISSIAIMVDAIKLGALDFIEKPLVEEALLQKVVGAINEFQKNIDVITRYKLLTDKEKQIFAYIVLGATNQKMTEKLYISRSTVEKHRASVMKKMEAGTLPCLVKMLPVLSPLSIDFHPLWCDLDINYQICQ